MGSDWTYFLFSTIILIISKYEKMRVCVLHILPDIAQGWDISVELNPSHPGSLLLDPDKIMLVEVQQWFICDGADPEWRKGVREEIGRREARKAEIILNIFLSHTETLLVKSNYRSNSQLKKIAQKMPALNHTNSVAYMLPFHSSKSIMPQQSH